MTYYILFKRRTAKTWSGAIPAKKGVAKTSLTRWAATHFSSRMRWRIGTKKDVDKLQQLKKQKKKKK